MNDETPRRVRRTFRKAPEVAPPPIRGDEPLDELIERAFPAFVGRQVRDAYRLMKESVRGKRAVFLTLSGAMTPAGLHASCIVPLLERGFVDCITTTGANLYHDAHRVLGHRIREIRPDAGDRRLRDARIIRVYDLGFDEEVLLDTDRLFSALLAREEFQRDLTTPELHDLLGARLAEIEEALGVETPSLLVAAHRARVPIFVGAPQDGSIFLNVVKLRRVLGGSFRMRLDAAEDVFDMAALQHFAGNVLGRELAIWILGGGVPKNYTLQGEPMLSQILGVETDGFAIDVQFCVDPVDNGALSSCPAGEGHTWGKVSAEGVERSVYAHCDVTAVFPFLVRALLEKRSRPRRSLRLLDRLTEARAALDREIEQRKPALRHTLRPPRRLRAGLD